MLLFFLFQLAPNSDPRPNQMASSRVERKSERVKYDAFLWEKHK
jgi:hypothetical protein